MAGSRIDGFTATTKVGTIVNGEYSARVTHTVPAVHGEAAASPAATAQASKQALLGSLPTPSFLAEVK
jgi:hypothetical protein